MDGVISKGEMLKIINEPFKIGICRECSRQRVVTKTTSICQKCAPKLVVESNVPGNETDSPVEPETSPQDRSGAPQAPDPSPPVQPEGAPLLRDSGGSGGDRPSEGSTGGQE